MRSNKAVAILLFVGIGIFGLTALASAQTTTKKAASTQPAATPTPVGSRPPSSNVPGTDADFLKQASGKLTNACFSIGKAMLADSNFANAYDKTEKAKRLAYALDTGKSLDNARVCSGEGVNSTNIYSDVKATKDSLTDARNYLASIGQPSGTTRDDMYALIDGALVDIDAYLAAHPAAAGTTGETVVNEGTVENPVSSDGATSSSSDQSGTSSTSQSPLNLVQGATDMIKNVLKSGSSSPSESSSSSPSDSSSESSSSASVTQNTKTPRARKNAATAQPTVDSLGGGDDPFEVTGKKPGANAAGNRRKSKNAAVTTAEESAVSDTTTTTAPKGRTPPPPGAKGKRNSGDQATDGETSDATSLKSGNKLSNKTGDKPNGRLGDKAKEKRRDQPAETAAGDEKTKGKKAGSKKKDASGNDEAEDAASAKTKKNRKNN